MFSIAERQVHPPRKDMDILIHLAPAMLALVRLILADSQIDDRVNGYVHDDMRGIAQDPCEALILVVSSRYRSRAPDGGLDDITSATIVHGIGPSLRVMAGHMKVRVIRTHTPQFAETSVRIACP